MISLKTITKKGMCRFLLDVISKAPILASTYCWIELFLYSVGSDFPYRDLPRAPASDRFFDLRIWTFNGYGCDIPIEEIALKKHCAIDSFMFNYPPYPLWLIRSLHIGRETHSLAGLFIGTISICLFASFVSSILSEATQKSVKTLISIASCICILSFPFRYALERGQIDLVVFSIVLVGVIPLHWGKVPRLESLFAPRFFIALLLATLAKAFTLPSLAAISGLHVIRNWIGKSAQVVIEKPSRLGGSIIVIATFVIIASLILPIAFKANSVSFLEPGGHGFGFKTLNNAAYISDARSAEVTKVIFIVIGSASFIRSCIHSLNQPFITLAKAFQRLTKIGAGEAYLVAIAFFLPILYLSTESINYKWIFIAPIPVICFALTENKHFFPCKKPLFYLGHSILAQLILMKLPFSPISYAHIEWFLHFALHPFVIGSIAGLGVFIVITPSCSVSAGWSVANEV